MKRTSTKKRRIIAAVALLLLGLGTANAQTGPKVNGAVFGGGRMANVGGTTTVTVHNADSLGAVFGGNDISGSSGAATINIGTSSTSSSATGPDNTTLSRIKIGSVYGGGNGYYLYKNSARSWKTESWSDIDSTSRPNIPSTTINIASTNGASNAAKNLVQIDSVFGGAKAADVDSNDTGIVNINVGGGTILALFGGNNFGGELKFDGTINIDVHGTMLLDELANFYYQTDKDVPTPNTASKGYGREYGIRYLFGGGNLVNAPNVNITLTGGMIDTAFAGGNLAPVATAVVDANYEGSDVIYDNPTRDKILDGNGAVKSEKTWVGGIYRYNVHTLFGGNNQADMSFLPTLNLNGGGFGTVYGGGNLGDMTADAALSVASSDDNYNDLTRNGGITYHLGTYIHLPSSSKAQIDYLYGGCQQADVTNGTFIYMEGGEVGTIYGGCNVSGDVSSVTGFDSDNKKNKDGYGTNVAICGGTIFGTVFGGANGYYHCNDLVNYTDGNHFKSNPPYESVTEGWEFDIEGKYIGSPIPTHNCTHTLIKGGKLYGNVYAAANLASVGYGSTVTTIAGVLQNYGSAQLYIKGSAEIYGNVYGGGNMASVFGTTDLQVTGGTIYGDLYAGNDKTGSVQAFGPLPTNNASNGTPLNSGNEPLYSAYVLVQGSAKVHKVFGGGNGAYNYGDNDSDESLDLVTPCSLGGINTKPLQKSSFVDINLDADGWVDTVFGGGNGVTVVEGVTVLINSTPALRSDGTPTIGTIFGGNNQSLMRNIVADLLLEKGTIQNVYGGGNAGDMEGTKHFTDICGNTVVGNDGQPLDISTHILVNSKDITVKGDMYAGCNMANLKNTAYVEIRETSAEGIYRLFGGNNISGYIENTRIDITGGTVKNIFGGSNGQYFYDENYADAADHVVGAAYPLDTDGVSKGSETPVGTGKKFNNTEILKVSSPIVDSTNVNIYGGNIESSVYGGGLYGDVRSTYVLVDQLQCPDGSSESPTVALAKISGEIYGGGQGNYNNLCAFPHKGNVAHAKVDLKKVGNLSGAKVYAGGRGGDVAIASLTVHDSWNQNFDAVYGGCWGSDILGATHVTMNGTGFVTNFYGGNDYTGNVKATYVNINAGRYENIYGAGNGDYDYTGTDYEVPNIEDVTINIANNNLIKVEGNLYGGGRMGTTMKVNHTSTTEGEGENAVTTYYPIRNDCKLDKNIGCSATEVAYIMMNIHGGEYMHDIYAGGAGKEKDNGGTQITYAVKQINMDNGTVHQSIYGGTQNVEDGFGTDCPQEGEQGWKNTMPSSILNLTGGTFMANAYGGGYLGNIYGSTYVNIGIDAVKNSEVWTSEFRTVNGSRYSVADKKPNIEGNETLVANRLVFTTSIYSGANWGEASGIANFETTRGFFGGTSKILIDGNGYNESDLPVFDISKSIIGAGTSTKGGDLSSTITVCNYGKMNGCNGATKMLESIQRTDTLTLENTAIVYTGSTDASMALSAINYSINRINKLMIGKGFNNLTIQHPVDNVAQLVFQDASGEVINAATALSHSADACNTTCGLLTYEGTDGKTLFYVQNGAYVRVALADPSGNFAYGDVKGWAYVVTDEGMAAQLMAATTTGTAGGYVSPCTNENNYTDNAQIGFEDIAASPVYRFWQMGTGLRSITQQIDAYSNPTEHTDINRFIKTDKCGTSSGEVQEINLAKATVYLPTATSTGHTYKLTGVEITDGKASLDPVAWKPSNGFNNLASTGWDDASVNDVTKTLALGQSDCLDASTILSTPNEYFGLMLVPNTNTFESGDEGVAISGTYRYSESSTYTTVATRDPGMPQLDVYLTYSNQFSKSLLADVVLTFMEYEPTTDGGTRQVGEVSLTLTINTIIDNIKGTHLDMLAMNNEGTSNNYTRKRIIPATLRSQDVYLSSVRWEPITSTDLAGGEYILGDRNPVAPSTDATAEQIANGRYFKLSNSYSGDNQFTLKASLAEDLTGNLTAINGWYTKDKENFNVYDETATQQAKNTASTPLSNPAHMTKHNNSSNSVDTVLFSKDPSWYTDETNGSNSPEYVDGHSNNDYGYTADADRGLKLGRLDGRSSAAIDYELGFDGSEMFPKGFVGRVILDYAAYMGADFQGRFYDTIFVRSRDHGDTIFLASAETLTKCEGSVTLTHMSNSRETEVPEHAKWGKRPKYYLRSFKEAFQDPYIYQEGDVFAIMDEINITENTVLRGDDLTRIPVIRYSGHHSDLPGECGAYRGAMFNIQGGAQFYAYNVSFDGSAVTKIWPNTWTAPAQSDLKEADTLRANGPIFNVEPSSKLTLADGSVVKNNFNRSTTMPGAIYLDGGATTPSTLTLNNGVTIQNNLNVKNSAWTELQPNNGTVYAKAASVVIGTNANGAIVVDGNYVVDADFVYANTDKTAYVDLSSEKQGNVFLGRIEQTESLCDNTNTDDLKDAYNSLITFSSNLPTGSHIGVSKDFPGIDLRDTISVVNANLTTPDYINNALATYFFVDNNAYDFFYKSNGEGGLNSRRFYFHRCASFRNQHKDEFCENAVVVYDADLANNCAPNADKLTYNFRGGFAPYTIEWKKGETAVNTDNTTIDVKPTDARLSSSYTLPSDDLQVGYTGTNSVSYSVTATDLFGCEASKNITITLQRSQNPAGVSTGDDNFAATASATDSTRATVATFTRNYKGEKIDATVWPEGAGSIAASLGESTFSDLANTYFCEGEVVNLTATAATDKNFIMWDVNPYEDPSINYVVNAFDNHVKAYFGPNEYWYQEINSLDKAASYDTSYYANNNRAGYVTTYNGDVHIYDENGLAWFISVVNGLNNVQSRQFYFNKVYLHQKSDNSAYDMGSFLWTPVGREQHPFRGQFIGVESATNSTTELTGENRIVVKNIIVNEPNLNYVGFFGHLDSAQVRGIELQSSLVRGAQYVGGIAAKSSNSEFKNIAVKDNLDETSSSLTTILASRHTVGGMIGHSTADKVESASTAAKYMGSVVYAGGMVGQADNTTVSNSSTMNQSRLEGVYVGGLAGRLNGTAPASAGLFRGKTAGQPAVLRNNFVSVMPDGSAQHMGGLVGTASNAIIENNYVFGSVDGTLNHGALAAELGQNVQASNNYYELKTDQQAVGQQVASAHVVNAATFVGQGNQVVVDRMVYGVDNLTRVLNFWVRENNADSSIYRTWRSDLDGINSGYPLFGTPDLIPVNAEANLAVCDSIVIDGITYTSDATVLTSVVDSLMMVDSLTTLTLTVHQSSHQAYSDSALVGQSYSGYGFSLSAAETELLRNTVDTYGSASMVLTDTLATQFGCDSIVSLTLTFTKNEGIDDVQPSATAVNVYPNPTTSSVTVATEHLRFVELFDNDGRRLMSSPQADNGESLTLDVSRFPSGAYYLRIHTDSNVTIQKLIKK